VATKVSQEQPSELLSKPRNSISESPKVLHKSVHSNSAGSLIDNYSP